MRTARENVELTWAAVLPQGLRHDEGIAHGHAFVGGGVPNKHRRGIGRDITLARIRLPILRVGAAGAAGKGGPAIKLRVSADHGKILEKLGAEVVFPERDMALRLANRLETDRVLDFVQFSEKINITKMRTPEAFVGKRVLDVNLRSRFGLNIIAIENDRTVIEVVQPEHVFSSKDVLYLAGSKDGLLKLSQWMERQ